MPIPDRLYWWSRGRPVVSLFIKDRFTGFPPKYFYVVRNHRISRYWRDPYGLRSNAGDPRSDWGERDQAWKFGTEESANQIMGEFGVTGSVEKIQLS